MDMVDVERITLIDIDAYAERLILLQVKSRC